MGPANNNITEKLNKKNAEEVSRGLRKKVLSSEEKKIMLKRITKTELLRSLLTDVGTLGC